jgi:hypothetical protein
MEPVRRERIWTASCASSVFTAAYYDNLPKIVEALDDGFCPATEALVPGNKNCTLLHYAVGHPKLHGLVPRLLAAGWDPNARHTHFGTTPLFNAFGVGSLPVIKALCAAGGLLNTTDTAGETPYTYWAQQAWWMPSNLAIATWLVNQQVDLTCRNTRGSSLLDVLWGKTVPGRYRSVMPNKDCVLDCLEHAVQHQQSRWSPARSAWIASCACATSGF